MDNQTQPPVTDALQQPPVQQVPSSAKPEQPAQSEQTVPAGSVEPVQPTQPIPPPQSTDIPISSPPPSNNISLTKGPIIVGIVALIAVIGMGAYILFGTRHAATTPTVAQVQPTNAPQSASSVPLANQVLAKPTPVISPVTTANVDQTLSTTNTSMQQTIDQANTDINSLNTIDTTQDNTNGL